MSIFENAPESKPAGAGMGEGPLLAVWFLVTLALAVFVLARSEHRSLHDPVKKAERGEITGLGPDSLVRPAAFAKALAKIGARLGDEDSITNLRLSPVELSATVTTADYKERIIRVGPSFKVDDRDFSDSEDKGFTPALVDPLAPQRIIAAVARRERTTPEAQAKRLDYMSLSPDADRLTDSTWYVTFVGGRPSRRTWVGHLHGEDVHRSGEPDPVDVRAQAAAQRFRDAQQRARQQLDRRFATASGERQIRLANARSECVSDATTYAQLRRCVR
jgi:hypothetical protein